MAVSIQFANSRRWVALAITKCKLHLEEGQIMKKRIILVLVMFSFCVPGFVYAEDAMRGEVMLPSPTNSGEPPLDYGPPAYLIPATTMASAAEPIPRGIRGQYAFTGGGASLIAPLGFETDLKPKGPPGAYIFQTFNIEGVCTFRSDGTGSFKGLNHLVALPFTTPNPNPPPPTITHHSAGVSSNVTYLFHYTMADDGKITITADPGTYTTEYKSGPAVGKTYHLNGFSRMGFITPDGKMIALTGGAPSVMSFIAPFEDMPPTAQIIVNSSMVLFYQHD